MSRSALAAAALLAVAHRRAVGFVAVLALAAGSSGAVSGVSAASPRPLASAASSPAMFGAERRPLAVAVLADGQQVAFRVGDDHADDLVALRAG